MESSSAPPGDPPAEPLQFDKAEFKDAPAARSCAACRQPIASEYFAVGGAVICPACARQLSGAAVNKRALLRAAGYGFGAALVGVLIWTLMIRLTDSELGIVAIGVGLLVGMAVRKGAGGRGGWKFQALAMALTYFSITASYVPYVLKAFAQSAHARSESKAKEAPSKETSTGGAAAPAASTLTSATATPPAPAASSMPVGVAVLLFVALVFGLAFAAPFLAGASNILGILIIGFALYEAWKLNRRIPVTGPFRLGQEPAPPAAP